MFVAVVEPRGFGFVTFTEYAAVTEVLEVLVHRINDKIVTIYPYQHPDISNKRSLE